MGFVEEFRAKQKAAWLCAEEHGFHEDSGNPLFVPTALALVASEAFEAETDTGRATIAI